ncbi:MAG: DNA internalization-related competence protein ComEC/Rec2 [Firmicutes bacterium]|nr:DNA internalization-related competence protein ComEC/Rec2 [Bacillota bacterium]MBU4533455.1 DNA internalization-related competence protein ComEC/Rec2 [Bacillota bacterium]MBV1727324.1 DNA internalization-related competence protein ComEC/Rec2 [Desulforudis sp.]MBV1734637.1 DNA internalization-related competence protein ComEC/Rec2 [Desulforudis sp.]
MTSRPLVLFVFLFALGIILAPYITVPVGSTLLASSVAVVVAGLLYFSSHKSTRFLFFVLFVMLGVITAQLDLRAAVSPLERWVGQPVVVEGMVDRDPEVRDDRAMYTLTVEKATIGSETLDSSGGRLLVTHYQPDAVYGYGDVLEVRGLLQMPADPGNPGAFNYRAYLERQGISLVVMVNGDQALVKTGVGGNPLVTQALWVKGHLCRGLDWALEPAAAEVVKGIILGMRSGIDPQVREAFTATGVVHILAVSGLHVGFLLGLVMFLLNAARLKPVWIIILGSLVLLGYMLMVGFKPSVVRASTMAIMLLVAYQIGRLRDWPTALAVAAFAILLANPLLLYDPGFQLSFAATWGILYLGPLLVKAINAGAAGVGLGFWRPAFSWVLVVPLGAQVGTALLVVYYYNLVSPVALLANVVAVPIVALIFILGLFTAVTGAIVPALGWLPGSATGALVDLFLWVINLFAALPGAYFYVATPAPGWIAVYFVFLFALGQVWTDGSWREKVVLLRGSLERSRRTVMPIAVMLAVGLVLVWVMMPSTGDLDVHFIDVGQGDSCLIRTPSGKTMLIDAGGRVGELENPDSGVGKNVVVPYLQRLGVKKIDVLVMTHPHEDHIGGVRAVVNTLPVTMAVVASPDSRSGVQPPEQYVALLKEMQDDGINIHGISAGDRIRLDPRVRIDVLGPLLPLMVGGRADLNNNSLVLRLAYGRHTFLFTGDVEQEAQARLIMSGADLHAHVLKVPHHGSGAFVPAFFEAVHPEIAVVPVGANNRFGLPKETTLEKLEALGSRVYRTDLDGAVIIRSDGTQLDVRTGRENGRVEKPAA